MKNKKLAIIIIAVIVIGILAIVGIGMIGKNNKNNDEPLTFEETLDLIQKNESITIEIAVPESIEQGTENQFTWTILAELDTYQDTLRTPMEEAFYVTTNAETGEKEGYFYRDQNGNTVQNNTFKEVFTNQISAQMLDKDEVISALSDAACGTYADLEADEEYTNALLALNGYFNLLPDAQPNYCNPNSTLSRAELMAMIMRADTPVDTNLTVDSSFESVVGKSELNLYAQVIDKDAYLNTSDSSLNEKTYTGTISRAEAIYLLVNHYYGDTFKNFDMSSSDVEFADAKDGGDIATEQGFADKNYSKSYELVWAINNPDGGLPTDLYKALVFAEQIGLIDEDTRWDEGLTKAEAIEFMITVYGDIAQINSGEVTTNQDNSYYYNEDGTFDRGWDEAGITRAEDAEDGWLGYKVMYNDDGTTYLLYNKDGSRYDLLDTLPDGGQYMGTTEADQAAIHEWYMNN